MKPGPALLLLAALPLAAFADAYRWVDRDGRVHYGQVPPPGASYEEVRPAYPPAPAPNQASLNKSLSDTVKAEPEQKVAAEKAAAEKSRKQEACRQAVEGLAYFDSQIPNRTLVAQPDGSVSRATEEEFARRRAEYEKLQKDNC